MSDNNPKIANEIIIICFIYTIIIKIELYHYIVYLL